MSPTQIFLAFVILIAATNLRAAPPNIVLIFTDDQRYDAVGYSGNTAVHTPHLDALARGGTIFRNCFVNTSICAISRANLLMGQYPSRHGVDDFFKTLSDKQMRRTVPARLQDAGYQTAFFGKWGIGDSAEATHRGASIFDYWSGQPHQTSFFHEPGCRYVNFDGFARPLNDLCDCPADSRGVSGFRNRIGRSNLADPLHTDADVIPLHVARFLKGRDRERPFCMWLHFKAPHSPFGDWDEQQRHVTDGLSMPVPPSATIDLAEREPDIIKRSLGAPSGRAYLTQEGKLDQHMRDYYRLVSSMDAGVGRVMDAIAQCGERENTVVLFTSDNGHFKGEHGLAGKWLMHEPSLRVPGFIADARVDPHKHGQISTRMVITTDFSVTMLALAGIEAPDDMAGRDLTILADDPAAEWRTEFRYEHPYVHDGSIPSTVGVRTERYSYIRYTSVDPPIEQLFDLHTDPNQITDLVTSDAHADSLDTLRQLCDGVSHQ